MNKEPRTMQAADAVTASRAPENTPAMVKENRKDNLQGSCPFQQYQHRNHER